jgi:hypothetical protein
MVHVKINGVYHTPIPQKLYPKVSSNEYFKVTNFQATMECNFKYYLTDHFVERYKERFINCKDESTLIEEIKKLIVGSEVAFHRPNNVASIIRHNFQESVYLINQSKTAQSVIVVVKNKGTSNWSICNTIYRLEDCKWAKQYINNGKRPKMTWAGFIFNGGYEFGTSVAGE